MSTVVTRQSVERDRRAWAEFLMQPERKKATAQLTTGGEARCCLGHACQLFLGDPEDEESWLGAIYSLPHVIVERLGLWGDCGEGARVNSELRGVGRNSLARFNDETAATPRQIGTYILTVIGGGEDTPFRPLAYFPDAAVSP